MATLLALLSFAAITSVFGILLAWLSSSSSALQLRLPIFFRTGAHGSSGKAGAEPLSANDSTSVSTDASPDDQPIAQLIEAVNAKLPQTQCAQCGHPGCRPYATAIVLEDVPINQCPPGGNALISELAEFLGKEAIPLDTQRGTSKPPQVALIDEPACIGCTLCILACPVDAIIGASRLMHTVISDQCTGCELCLPPCPVDCIELVPASTPLAQWLRPKPV